MKKDAVGPSETSVSYHTITRSRNLEDHDFEASSPWKSQKSYSLFDVQYCSADTILSSSIRMLG